MRKNTKLREPSVTSDVSIEKEVGDLQVTMKKLKKVGLWQLELEG